MSKSSRRDDRRNIQVSLVRLIKRSGKTREQIAEEMTQLLGEKITPRALYKFTADSRCDYRWPAMFDIAFCEVLGDYSLLRERISRAGFRMIGPKEERLLLIGKAYEQKLKAEKVLSGVEL